jgi:hypothetical protein
MLQFIIPEVKKTVLKLPELWKNYAIRNLIVKMKSHLKLKRKINNLYYDVT